MYSRNSFGSFYPINSVIHRLNPVMKLINFIICILILILSSSIYVNGFVLIFIFIMILLSYVPFRYYLNTIWSLRYIYILIAFLCLYFDLELTDCFCYIFKLTSFVEYLNLLAFTTSPSESIYGIEKFLSFFNFLYLPVSKLAIKINSILRYIPLWLSVEYKTYKATSSRGRDYSHSNIFGRMYTFLSVRKNINRLVKNKNKETYLDSELRLYDSKKYRTNYRTNKVTFIDIFFLLFHLGLFYTYLVSNGVL